MYSFRPWQKCSCIRSVRGSGIWNYHSDTGPVTPDQWQAAHGLGFDRQKRKETSHVSNFRGAALAIFVHKHFHVIPWKLRPWYFLVWGANATSRAALVHCTNNWITNCSIKRRKAMNVLRKAMLCRRIENDQLPGPAGIKSLDFLVQLISPQQLPLAIR